MKRFLPVLLPLVLLAGCGGEETPASMAERISARPIKPLLGEDEVKLTQALARARVACAVMHGVSTDDAGTEFLVLCADDPTPAMLGNYGDPGWSAHSVWLSTGIVRPGNLMPHCAPVASTNVACQPPARS